MKKQVVKSKKELKDAINKGIDFIEIAPEFQKDMEGVVKLMKLPSKKITATISFLAVSGAAIVASIAAAPATAGTSGVAGVVAGVPLVGTFALASGVSVSILIPLIVLCVGVGVPTVVHLLRAYDVEEDEYEFESGPVKFRKRTKYREHT